jgi:hypothetical protein
VSFLNKLTQIIDDVHTIATNLPSQPSKPATPSGPQPLQPSTTSSISPYPITDSVSVTLDVNGNGTATITPGQASPGGGVGIARNSGYSWDITGTYVSASEDTSQATATTYISYGIQSTNPEDAVGTTALGSSGDTGTFTAHLLPGDWVTTQWAGGTPGAIATMKITGTVNPPGA